MLTKLHKEIASTLTSELQTYLVYFFFFLKFLTITYIVQGLSTKQKYLLELNYIKIYYSWLQIILHVLFFF